MTPPCPECGMPMAPTGQPFKYSCTPCNLTVEVDGWDGAWEDGGESGEA